MKYTEEGTVIHSQVRLTVVQFKNEIEFPTIIGLILWWRIIYYIYFFFQIVSPVFDPYIDIIYICQGYYIECTPHPDFIYLLKL